MDYDYEKYEENCRKIRADNEELLELFASSLENLSRETARKHISNVEFYLNNYLLYEDALTFQDGLDSIDDFLGYFFIRKCLWSTPGTIKSTAASIKKFYKCMLEHGKIEKDEYDFFCEDIKIGMPQWQADCAQFNNPNEDSPFGFF